MSDGYAIAGRFWAAPASSSPPRPVLYLHGIQSHGGWYEWTGSLLAEDGASVFMPDRRGSGLNEAARGDVPSATRWIVDVDAHVDWLCDQTGAERVMLIGVSWGGKLAAAWALHRPERVERLMLITPGIFPAVDLTWLQKVGVGYALLRDPNRYFPIPLNDPALFTNNPAGHRFIDEDPFKLMEVTARFLFESRRLDRSIARAAPGSLLPPTALLCAGHELIVQNEPTRAWLRRTARRAAAIVEFPNDSHTLEFSPDPQRFVACLLAWARGGCPAPLSRPQPG